MLDTYGSQVERPSGSDGSTKDIEWVTKSAFLGERGCDANPVMRTFDTGATRNTEEGKLDYEGFLSPSALKRYAEYLNKHRLQADGKLRDSDNWQKGIPITVYMKSMFRHFMDAWSLHRNPAGLYDVDELPDALCAVIFNAMGYLHEITKSQRHFAEVTEQVNLYADKTDNWSE